MKLFLAAIMLIFSALSTAAEKPKFQFQFEDKDGFQFIIADVTQMMYIGETQKWILAAIWEPLPDNPNFVLMHSVTQYREVQQTDINKIEFDKIFSYGYIDCKQENLHLLNEFYTTTDLAVMLANKFTSQEYIVDLNANLILQVLLTYSCRPNST